MENMTAEEFNEIYTNLKPSRKRVLELFLKGESYKEISHENMTPDTARQHISAIYELFRISNDLKRGNKEELIELVVKYRPDLVSEIHKNRPELKSIKPLENTLSNSCLTPKFPSGAIEFNSPFYIKRDINRIPEYECYRNILNERELIRISAPIKFGKTSLLNRILDYANIQNYRIININIKQEIDQTRFSELETFLRCFCNVVSDKLDLPSQPDDYWLDYRTPQINCTRYIEMLLKQSETPLILAIDAVEIVYDYDVINQEFFQMLRGWHDKAAVREQEFWKRLRQVIVYSCDNYGRLDLSRSPFNVGRHYELEEFTESQIFELVQKYSLNWNLEQVNQLMSLIGGHPHLVNLTLYHFAEHSDITLEQFLQSPLTNEIYNDYLRPLVTSLESNSALKYALKEVINTTEGTARLELKLKNKLYSMGLIYYKISQIKIRCELFRQYFQEYLY